MVTRQAWSTIIDFNKHIQREGAAVACFSASKFTVFGGMKKKRLNTVYLFDTKTNQVKEILGSKGDLKLMTYTQVQWADKQKYITLGSDGEFLHLAQLLVKSEKYAELRSIARLGHLNRDDEEVNATWAARDARENRRDEIIN